MYTESEKTGRNLPRSFLLLPQTQLTDTPRIRRGPFPPPCFTSCPAALWRLPSQLTSPVCWGCCCSILISPGCDRAREKVSCSLPMLWLKSGWTVGTGWREAPCKNVENSFRGGICGFLSKVTCPGHVAKSCHYSHYVNIPSTRWRFFYVFLKA